ncbi:MAG: hypothetical protein AB1552_02100 [Nitrospirota bacterium]
MPFTDILSREDDLRTTEYRHEIMVGGSDFATCRQKVMHFFGRYQLVRYSMVTVVESESLPATSPAFSGRLAQAVAENRRIVHDLIREFQDEGITTLTELGEIPQGYKSKMLHVITHFLDGFFGIDTFFYNLEDDTHWITDEFQKKVDETPSHYWLLSVRAKI